MRSRRLLVILIAIPFLLSACRQGEAVEADGVTSYLSGQFSVDPAIDSTRDYRDFEVLVYEESDAGLDTLGSAVTDSAGLFSVAIHAKERGIYPLVVSRRGTILKRADIAVAEGDSGSVSAVFPVDDRFFSIRSPENAALTAYRNTIIQHNKDLYTFAESAASPEAYVRRAEQTAHILWSMRETFPGTIGAEVGAAEAIVMLPRRNDSLAVAYALQLEPSNPRYAEVARAARLAETDLSGPRGGQTVLQQMADRVPSTDTTLTAALEVERIRALAEEGRREPALNAARALAANRPGTSWAQWAERIQYDLETLSAGMPAPPFTLTDVQGRTFSLDSLQGRLVLLEFYDPEDTGFQQELPQRNALVEAGQSLGLVTVSVSVQPDTTINAAFYEGRQFPGIGVIASGGMSSPVVKKYNVSTLPRRFLIGPGGQILGVYEGPSIAAVRNDLMMMLQAASR